MLTGVWASSARKNEGWLSEEACLEGRSKEGVPARLSGREKLKEGRGRPDESDAMEGDLWKLLARAPGAAKALLAEDSLRAVVEQKELAGVPVISPSIEAGGEDLMLDVRLDRKGGLGGARPASSNDGRVLSGETASWVAGKAPGIFRTGDFSERFSMYDWVSLWMGDGERVRVPKKLSLSLSLKS